MKSINTAIVNGINPVRESSFRRISVFAIKDFQKFFFVEMSGNASAERKRMILCTLFKEITIGKGYKIEILMDNSYEQFIA